MRHHERGSALLIAMLIMLAMAVLGATFLSVSITDRKIASNEADAGKAFAVAEAGIEDARAALATTNVNTLLAGGGHLFTGSSVGGGTYVVDVTNNVVTTPPHVPAWPTAIVPLDPGGISSDTDRFLVVNSTGTLKKASRRIEAVVRIPTSFFNYGLWCNAASTFQGASDMDAYDSRLGAYDTATNRALDAGAYCNGNITMQSSSHIWGDCTVSTTSCDDNSHWTSNTNNAPAQTLTAPACPAGAFTASVPAGPGVSYNAGTGDLTVSGGTNTLTLPVPPTTYYFHDLTVSSSTLTFNNPSNLHVDMYVSGQATVSGTGIANPSSPPALTLWACGAATNSWTISGGSDAKMAIFAPTRNLTLSGNSPLFGAIVAKQFTNSGHVHYDHALASSGFPSVVGRTWREIFP